MDEIERVRSVAMIGWTVWFVAVIAALITDHNIDYPTTLTAGYLIAGTLFTPHLNCLTTPNPLIWWGPLKQIWAPYRFYIPHKSLWSHTYVLGVTVQMLYFAAVLAFCYSFLYGLLAIVSLPLPTPNALICNNFSFACNNPGIVLTLWLGMILGNGCHLFMDGAGIPGHFKIFGFQLF